MGKMTISKNGINLIKKYEGCRLTAYKPVASEVYYTIGYGHYGPDVVKDMTITQKQADEYLMKDIASFETIVESTCDYLQLNQNEFDALVSFTFNCGGGGLLQLTANKTRTKKQMMEHILAYNKGADGKVLEGLVRRRTEEKELFETPTEDANKDKFDYLGITAWHNAGFKGKGIKIASRESLTDHGKKVYDVLKMVAPEAEIYVDKQYTKDIGEGIDIYTTSLFQKSDAYSANKKKAQSLYDSGVMLCCAVGNDSDDSCTELAKQDCWTSIGACNLLGKKPIKMFYSSESETLDFMSFSNIVTPDGLFTGTSCAAPAFAGMMALVKQYYRDVLGKVLTPEELYKFAKEHCEDMEEKGADMRTGYGLFVLPPIETMEEKSMKYEKLEEIPEWGKPSIEKLISKGVLKGNENGLDLSEDMLRMLVILDRAKVFDKN